MSLLLWIKIKAVLSIMKKDIQGLSIASEFDYSRKTKGNYGKFWFERYKNGQQLYQRFAIAKYTTVNAELAQAKKMLDVGCGFGDSLFLFQDKFDEVVGIDPSLEMVDICKYNIELRCKNARVEQGVCERMHFSNNSFDTVLLLDVFEHFHVETIKQSLLEIHRVLSPTGNLIIVTPSRFRIKMWCYFDNFLKKIFVDRTTSIFQMPKKNHTEVFYNKKEVVEILKESGFMINKFKFTSFYPAPERIGVLNKIYRRTMHISLLRKLITGVFIFCEALPFFRQKMFFEFKKQA